MTTRHRHIFRTIVASLFLGAGVLLATSPTSYKVDLDALVQIWGDVFRDLDAVVKTVRISTDLEVEFGDEIASRFWTRTGDAELQARVAAVGARVSLQARRQDIPWRFHLLPGGAPNAWAILGGHIYITEAMLEMIDSEAELAAILGHEIAHVDLRHCVDRAQNELLLEKVGLGLASIPLAMAERFVTLGFSEVQEVEADRYGMLLAAQAGYSPLSAFDTFRKFYIKYEADAPQRRSIGGPEGEITGALVAALDDYFDTHPPFGDRLDALRDVLHNNVEAWEGMAFRVGRRSAKDWGKSAEADMIFSEKAADYLALRTLLAHFSGRSGEARRYLDRLEALHGNDPRVSRLEALLSGGE